MSTNTDLAWLLRIHLNFLFDILMIMKIKQGYMDAETSRLYYEIDGNPKGAPVLLLHGGLGSISNLAPIYPYLSSDHLIISTDFRGHGKSSLGHKPLSYLQYQRDIQALLRYLDIQRYSIVGFSDGGIVGYRLAAQQAQQVDCLITIGAQWRLTDNDPSIEILQGLTAEYWCSEFADDVTAYSNENPQPDFPRLLDAVKKVWLDTSSSGYPGALVEKIRCPTLIMRGDSDFLFSLEEAMILKSQIAQCHLANIPLTTHAAHQESPRITGEIIKQFMLNQKAQ